MGWMPLTDVPGWTLRLSTLALAAIAVCGCSKTTRVEVPADAGWVSTGIVLNANDRVRLRAEGVVNYGMPMSGGPDGYDHPSALALCPDVLCGALVGRIGESGTPFRLGSQRKIRTGQGGTLYLAVNDEPGQFGNNTGSFHVTIEVNP
jgi:hypothetical protein